VIRARDLGPTARRRRVPALPTQHSQLDGLDAGPPRQPAAKRIEPEALLDVREPPWHGNARISNKCQGFTASIYAKSQNIQQRGLIGNCFLRARMYSALRGEALAWPVLIGLQSRGYFTLRCAFTLRAGMAHHRRLNDPDGSMMISQGLNSSKTTLPNSSKSTSKEKPCRTTVPSSLTDPM
jgi:hypothetical protein